MKKLLITLAAIIISGCSTVTDYPITIVPQGVEVTQFNLQNSIVRKNVTGEDTNYILLFFPLGQPSFDKAVSNTLQNGHGQILTNATIIDRSRWFILFGYNQIEITGDVIDLK